MLRGPIGFGFSPCLFLDSISVDDSGGIRTGTGTVGDIDRQVYHASFDLFYNNAQNIWFSWQDFRAEPANNSQPPVKFGFVLYYIEFALIFARLTNKETNFLYQYQCKRSIINSPMLKNLRLEKSRKWHRFFETLQKNLSNDTAFLIICPFLSFIGPIYADRFTGHKFIQSATLNNL